MNDEDIKSILSTYRPGTEDDDDPFFQPALQALHKDPQLMKWFEMEQSFDHAMRSCFDSIPVPLDLKNRILTSSPPQDHKRPFLSFPAASAFILPLAALIILSLFLFNQLNPTQSGTKADIVSIEKMDGQSWHEAMAHWMSPQNLGTIRYVSSMDEIQSLMTSHFKGFPYAPNPSDVSQLPPVACQAIQWGDCRITLTCYRYSGAIVHFLVASDPTCSDSTDPLHENVIGYDDEVFQSVRWGDSNLAYLLLTRSSKEGILKKLMNTQNAGVHPISHSHLLASLK
jgi:hypothetical protein